MQWPQCATPPFMNHATPCNTLQYLAIPCYILLYSAIPCNTLQYHPACTSSIPAAFSLAILKWLPRQFLPLLLFTPFSPAAASLPFIMFNNRPGFPGSSDTFLERQFLFPLQRVSNDSRLVTTIQSAVPASLSNQLTMAPSLYLQISLFLQRQLQSS